MHQYMNERKGCKVLMVCVSEVAAIGVPSEPVKINGRGLEKPPFNAYHAQFQLLEDLISSFHIRDYYVSAACTYYCPRFSKVLMSYLVE